jgi:hypothetical protein
MLLVLQRLDDLAPQEPIGATDIRFAGPVGEGFGLLPGMVCLSSCPYVLAGGIERIVSPQGAVGLHQHYYDAPRLLPVFFVVEDIQQSQGQTMAHLIEMGIDPGLMVHSLSTPPNDIYVLIEEELLESRLATQVMDHDAN